MNKIAAAISAANKINPINSIIGGPLSQTPPINLGRHHRRSIFLFCESREQARCDLAQRLKSVAHIIIAAAMKATIAVFSTTANANRIFISSSV